MVMEASPSPQSVGREFVRQYYTLLNKAPAHLHRFYNNYSSFVHGGLDAPNRETLPVVGQKQIHNRIQQLNFRDCHAKISQVDAQATLGSGVVVQVTGELSNDGAPMRRFTQTFVLAAQSPKKYYVHNDIFRYQDIVFSDEEGDNSGRSEGEEEGAAGGYFPGSFPGGFPAPPPAPLSPPASAAAAVVPAPHLNGHPQVHEEGVRHVVAASLQATSLGASLETEAVEPSSEERSPPLAPHAPHAPPAHEPEPEPEPEPEAEREPEPECEPPLQPMVQVPPEPKTYANLLKSGGSSLRGSPPAPAPAAPAPTAAAPLPTPPPLHAAAAPPPPTPDQRPRHPRPPPPTAGEGREGRESRGGRYSDAQQLFLGNLPHSATEEELRALFARFGPVAELRVHSKGAVPGQARHPNYGFITYESSAHAHDCLAAAPLYFPADSADGAGVKLNVEEKKARGREPPPRRRPLSGQRGPAPAFPRPAFRR